MDAIWGASKVAIMMAILHADKEQPVPKLCHVRDHLLEGFLPGFLALGQQSRIS